MSYIHKWTHEEDEYILLAHENGVPITRMATRLGLHRETVKRRLTYLWKARDELSKTESLIERKQRAYRKAMEALENREPRPFVLWARGMINLNRRMMDGRE